MIKMIACSTANGIIGCDNDLAVKYKEDMSFFRKMTANSTVIMGLKTFQSMGNKPLPKRRNIVISSTAKLENLEVYGTMKEALDACSKDPDIWLIGGYSIYKEGMKYADEIFLTITKDVLEDRSKNYTDFPWINPLHFQIKSINKFENNENLSLTIYQRIV